LLQGKLADEKAGEDEIGYDNFLRKGSLGVVVKRIDGYSQLQ
jgi:hypothetical protein